jgi:hypothetical protein
MSEPGMGTNGTNPNLQKSDVTPAFHASMESMTLGDCHHQAQPGFAFILHTTTSANPGSAMMNHTHEFIVPFLVP